jgi:hypothetical protein
MLQFMLWFAAAWLAFGLVMTIVQVGKPRPPLTGGVAATSAIVGGAIIATLIVAALNV